MLILSKTYPTAQLLRMSIAEKRGIANILNFMLYIIQYNLLPEILGDGFLKIHHTEEQDLTGSATLASA